MSESFRNIDVIYPVKYTIENFEILVILPSRSIVQSNARNFFKSHQFRHR